MSKNEKIFLAVAVAVFILWRAKVAAADPASRYYAGGGGSNQVFNPGGGDFGGHGATGGF